LTRPQTRRCTTLVLSRKIDEKIYLSTSDGVIEIQLVDWSGRYGAKIGITAPTAVKIAREEVYQGDEVAT